MKLSAVNPTTITGQITGLVVLSVAVAYGLSLVAIYLLLSNDALSRRGPPPMSFVTVALLAEAAKSDTEISAILESAQRIGLPVTRVNGRASLQADERQDRSPLDKHALDRLRNARGMEPLRQDLYLDSSGGVLIRLRDGSAITFSGPRTPFADIQGFIMGPIFYALAVIGVCLVGISLYAARFITSPLSSFAEAAYSVGRAAGAEQPISERGPQEISRVARALNEMRSRIRALLDERTNMLTAISHDLRTPLTRIKLRAERFAKNGGGDIVAAGMFSDIARMELMLAETIAYLRDDSRAEPKQSMDVPSLLRTICTELSDLGEDVTYDGPDRLPYFCKPNAIARAINNIVDNAIRYGTRVSVGLRACPNTSIQIDVADNGPGISCNDRRQVFEPFFKANPARDTNGNDGFGLGLSIARNIVEDHDGTIELLECEPHGLRARIILPPRSA